MVATRTSNIDGEVIRSPVAGRALVNQMLLEFYHRTVRGLSTEELRLKLDRIFFENKTDAQRKNKAARRRSYVRQMAGMDYKAAKQFVKNRKLSWRVVKEWAEWNELGVERPLHHVKSSRLRSSSSPSSSLSPSPVVAQPSLDVGEANPTTSGSKSIFELLDEWV